MKSKLVKTILGILALWFIMHTLFITIDGLNDERIKSDVGVVFGNKVNPDGSLSERLKKRLDKTIELFHDSTINLIVVSGGLGKEGFYEGTRMQEYLIKNGIHKSNIIVDNAGDTTDGTAENFKRMNLDVKSVTVISQYYHISRCKLAFRNKGYDKVYGVHADHFEIRDIYSLVREFFGYYEYFLR